MSLTPASIRTDRIVGNNRKLNCGPGSKPCGNACIPKAHQCGKSGGALSPSTVTKGLEKGSIKQLTQHRNALWTEQVRRYGKPINNEQQHNKFEAWSRKQPDRAEIDQVNNLITRKRRRNEKIATAITGVGLTAGILTAGVALSSAVSRR